MKPLTKSQAIRKHTAMCCSSVVISTNWMIHAILLKLIDHNILIHILRKFMIAGAVEPPTTCHGIFLKKKIRSLNNHVHEH